MSSLADGPANYGSLDFISPLSWARAEQIAARLAATQPSVVLDVGCGWGELLMQIVSRTEHGSGIGVDIDATSLDRARANASARGIDHRMTFVSSVAETGIAVADVVVCSGASQVFGTTAHALTAVFDLVEPGGTVLFADGFWDRAAPAGDGTVPQDMREMADLAGLVDEAIAAGFRPLSIETATRAEWEQFESGYLADWEHWLVDNATHPEAASVRSKADAHRNRWLRGYYHALGYAYLTLGRPR